VLVTASISITKGVYMLVVVGLVFIVWICVCWGGLVDIDKLNKKGV